MKRIKLTTWIIIGLVLGIVVGEICRLEIVNPDDRNTVAGYFALITDLFLRLIKMIIAPLVMSTLIPGVTKMGNAKAVGRVGYRTLLWFLGATFVSLVLGTLAADYFRPGARMHLPLPAAHAAIGIHENSISLKEFLTHLVPTSVFQAMATNEILQIVIFSAFFSLAMIAVGGKAKETLQDIFEAVSVIMFKVTAYIMALAPFAVFGALAHVIILQGLHVLISYGYFMGIFVGALLALWIVIIAAGSVVLGVPYTLRLVKAVREPMLLGFSTASGETAYPKLLEQLERSGVPLRISSFVLPLGYSFNLDGSMIYCSYAALFIAQAYGIHLSFMHQVTMLAILMLTSKGMAAVPKASIVVIAATLAQFNIPEEGLLLIMAVDTFLDMGRTATNLLGNSIASAVVTKWEGELGTPETDLSLREL
ncbi:MAG: dicarboxylate/amino acid:cation symporter [Burkholderiaceae bacterium]|nr:dicarboxylate/amino acid:cation symporter [Burkholderiaceae bacterium]